jgi:hypothetical protein
MHFNCLPSLYKLNQKELFDAPPKLLEILKCEFESEKMKEEGVGVCNLLACNTSWVRRACRSYRMGTRTSDK